MKTFFYDTIDSTNLEAQRLLNIGAKLPFIVIAYEQTEGKGRGENTWETEAGENLTCSFVVEPKIEAQNQYFITVATSIAIIELLKKYIPSKHIIKIKWPNDIYVDDNKICGILINNKILGDEIKSSIIGVGININQTQFPDCIPNSTSIKLITNRTIQLDIFLAELTVVLKENLCKIQSDYSELVEKYKRNLYKLNQPTIYNIDGTEVKHTISGIDEYGGIL